MSIVINGALYFLTDGIAHVFERYAGKLLLRILGKEAVKAIEKVAANEGVQLTKHGAERIAGTAATRGGVLSIEEVGAIRTLVKEPIIQAEGAKVFIYQISPGRYSGFIENQNTGKLITTMNNWSKKSINKMGKNYGWSVE